MKGLFLDLPEIVEAMNVLFGAGMPASPLSVPPFTPVSIRSAYRKRAFETHPDRAAHTGEPVKVLEEQFREVTEAYETLMRHVRRGGRLEWTLSGPWMPSGTRPGRTGFRAGVFSGVDLSAVSLYTGEIPRRRLLLGQYLYFSRMISRSSLGAALVWQKMGRPLIGQIAIKWKWLLRDDIRGVLLNRSPREKFCDAAERMGLLAPYQTLILLGRQRVLQPRLGQYFVEKGIFDAQDLAVMMKELRRHNKTFDR
jgi:hypothetical protein